MAKKIIEHDAKKYSDTPGIDAMKNYISECKNKPNLKRGEKGINNFDLVIK